MDKQYLKQSYSPFFFFIAFCFHLILYKSNFGSLANFNDNRSLELFTLAAGSRMAIIIMLGWRGGILTLLAEICGELLNFNTEFWSIGPIGIFFHIGVPSFSCVFIIGLLRKYNYLNFFFVDFNQFDWIIVAFIIVPLFYVTILTSLHIYRVDFQLESHLEFFLLYYLREIIGILMISPLIIFCYRFYLERDWSVKKYLLQPIFAFEFLIAIIMLWGIIQFIPTGLAPIRGILLLVPIISIALRHGLFSAALIVFFLNVLIIIFDSQLLDEQLFEHQVIIMIISILGLVIGGFTRFKVMDTEKMQEKIKIQHQTLTQLDRNNMLGNMTAEIIHEIIQPITISSIYVSEVVKLLNAGKINRKKLIKTMNNAANEMERSLELVRRMKLFARKGEVLLEETNVNNILEDMEHILLITSKKNDVKISIDISDQKLKLNVDKVQIQQAIMNLVNNSINALKNCKTREINISSGLYYEDFIYISIRDTGLGMSEYLTDNLSIREERMGLGLKIVDAIIEAHDGSVQRTKNTTYLIFKFIE